MEKRKGRTGPEWSALEDATMIRMRGEGVRMMDILPHLNGKTETQARQRIALLKLPPVSRNSRVNAGWHM